MMNNDESQNKRHISRTENQFYIIYAYKTFNMTKNKNAAFVVTHVSAWWIHNSVEN